MGFFFSEPKGRIKFKDLDKHLKELNFSFDQRQQLHPLFEKHKETGISKEHIKAIAKDLETNYSDRFTGFHAKTLKNGLLQKIEAQSMPREVKEIKLEAKPEMAKEIKITTEIKPPDETREGENPRDFKESA
ncbi:MAG: hypothetical protein KW793_02295 [Candidatus Doudnabacteria bacterium]|nr:hypothetical protein [Candidatus Doudnabacteria bacterium]